MCNMAKINGQKISLACCWMHENLNPRLFGEIFTYEINLSFGQISQFYLSFKQENFEKNFENYILNLKKKTT